MSGYYRASDVADRARRKAETARMRARLTALRSDPAIIAMLARERARAIVNAYRIGRQAGPPTRKTG